MECGVDDVSSNAPAEAVDFAAEDFVQFGVPSVLIDRQKLTKSDGSELAARG